MYLALALYFSIYYSSSSFFTNCSLKTNKIVPFLPPELQSLNCLDCTRPCMLEGLLSGSICERIKEGETMSSLRDFADYRSSGQAPEKSSVAQTCNRLSQLIKERGSLRDLGLGLAGKLEPKGRSETTIDLFPPNMEKPAQYELLDLFPQHTETGFPSTIMEFENASSSEVEAKETEPKTAQLTMFYGGKVFVFDNFPAEKVGEVMLFGRTSEKNPSSTGLLSTATTEHMKTKDSHTVAIPGPTADIPIARRASLHRFFDKRKERVASKAPYQVHGGLSTSSPKHKELIDLNL